MLCFAKDFSYRELLKYTIKEKAVMNTNDWIIIPQRGKLHELSEDQSYPKLLELMRDLDKERGHMLTDKQVNALQAFLQSLIDARARIKYYEG